MPIPPIQWVKLLQKRIDFGRASISVNMDDPVVENPETDSKKASENVGIAPEKRYGKQPVRLIANHEMVTVKYASFRCKEKLPLSLLPTGNNRNPSNSVIKVEIKNGTTSSK
jgi:hypothetical protein